MSPEWIQGHNFHLHSPVLERADIFVFIYINIYFYLFIFIYLKNIYINITLIYPRLPGYILDLATYSKENKIIWI